MDIGKWNRESLLERVYPLPDHPDCRAAKLDGSKAVRGGIPLVILPPNQLLTIRFFRWISSPANSNYCRYSESRQITQHRLFLNMDLHVFRLGVLQTDATVLLSN